MDELLVVDAADLSPVDDLFVELDALDGRPVRWRRHSGLPRNALERRVKRPRLSRYRAAWGAAQDARAADALISHLPLMTVAVAEFAAVAGVRAPHLAFSFNWTDPAAFAGNARVRRALGRVDRFATYTRFEAERYPEMFGLDPARFRPISWTQPAPVVADDPGVEIERPFVAAVGAEGRDFAGLVAAARRLPELPFVVIARPNAALAEAGPNVRVLFNLPFATCWAIARAADLLLVPLKGPEVCCGHLTLVSGRQLGIPIVTTASRGTAEYTDGFGGTRVVPPNDPDAFAGAIADARADLPALRAAAVADRVTAATLYARDRWRDHVADFLREVAR